MGDGAKTFARIGGLLNFFVAVRGTTGKRPADTSCASQSFPGF